MTAILVFGYYNSGARTVCDIMYEKTKNPRIHLIEAVCNLMKIEGSINILVRRQFELRHNNELKPVYHEYWLDKAPDSYFDYIIQNNRERQEDLEGSVHVIIRDIDFKQQMRGINE